MKITKSFTFDAGHTLHGHYGKCQHLHGHTYGIEVTVEGTVTDANFVDVKTPGMLLDFAYIKGAFAQTVGLWDHSYITDMTEDQVDEWIGTFTGPQRQSLGLHNQAHIIGLGVPPTAENMAISAAELLTDWIRKNCPVAEDLYSLTVTLHETPTSTAEYTTYFWEPTP